MNLIIKSIKIENFESIEYFSASFDRHFVCLSGLRAEVVLHAIGLVLGFKEMYPEIGAACRPGRSRISAGLFLGDREYDILIQLHVKKKTISRLVISEGQVIETKDFFRYIHQSPEEEMLSYYAGSHKACFAERLNLYKDDCLPTEDQTERIRRTQSFRKTLQFYISSYESEKLAVNKAYFMRLKPNGSFSVFLEEKELEPCFLSQTEHMIFDFLCFLNVNRFWKEIEDIRDINHVRWPLFIQNFIGSVDKTADISAWIKKTIELNRQTFLIVQHEKDINRIPGDKQIIMIPEI